MSSKQVVIVIVAMAVFGWSAVMAALGEMAAVGALVPSLGLLIQQIAQAVSAGEPRRSSAVPALNAQTEPPSPCSGPAGAAAAVPPVKPVSVVTATGEEAGR